MIWFYIFTEYLLATLLAAIIAKRMRYLKKGMEDFAAILNEK